MKHQRKGFSILTVVLVVIVVAILVLAAYLIRPQAPKQQTQTPQNQQQNNEVKTTHWKSGDAFTSFDDIGAYLKTQNPPVSIPVLLPHSFPTDFSQNDLYAYVDTSTSTYEISMYYGKDCKGEKSCFAVWMGTQEGSSFFNEFKNTSEKVNLVNNMVGYYKSETCGASCSPPEIVWLYKNIPYDIQAGFTKPELINLANSAIQNASQ